MAAKISGNQIVLKESVTPPAWPPSGSDLIYVNSSSAFQQTTYAGDIGTTRPLVATFDPVIDDGSMTNDGITGIRVWDKSVDTVNDLTIYGVPIPTYRNFISADINPFLGNTGASTDTVLGGVVSTAGTADANPTVSSGCENLLWTCSATNNTPGGIVSPNTAGLMSMWIDNTTYALFYTKIRTATVANMTIFAGLFSGLASSDDIGATQGAYFRYSTSASDTNWQGIVHASSANRTVQDLGVAVAGTTDYKLMLFLVSSGVRFYINGTYITEVAYPSGFGSFGAAAQISVQAKDSASKTFYLYNFYTEVNA